MQLSTHDLQSTELQFITFKILIMLYLLNGSIIIMTLENIHLSVIWDTGKFVMFT